MKRVCWCLIALVLGMSVCTQDTLAAVMARFNFPDTEDIITFGGGSIGSGSGAAPCGNTCSAEDCTYMELSAPATVVVGQWFWVEVKLFWTSEANDDEACYGIQAIIDFDPAKFEFEDADPVALFEEMEAVIHRVDNTTGYYAFMVAGGDWIEGAVCVWCNETSCQGGPCAVTVAKMRCKAKATMSPGQTLEFGDGHGTWGCYLNTVAVYDEGVGANCDPCPPNADPTRWERRLFDTNRIRAITGGS